MFCALIMVYFGDIFTPFKYSDIYKFHAGYKSSVELAGIYPSGKMDKDGDIIFQISTSLLKCEHVTQEDMDILAFSVGSPYGGMCHDTDKE